MILRCIALLSSIALAGCCSSGVSCTASAPSGGFAWDGLGPEENAASDNSELTVPRPASKRDRNCPSYGSAKKGAVIAAVGALALATLISLGAVYGLNRPLDPDELTTGSAGPQRRP
jgi:hypothetical protein